MNEDYLWDKSGEPDPEIEQLEQTLGRLRFKRPAEPLPLPATSRWSSRLSFSPVLAAAAALLVLLLAGGIWLGLRRSSSTDNTNPLATKDAPAAEKRSSEQRVSGPRPPLGSGSPIEAKLTKGVERPGAVSPESVAPRKPLPRSISGTRQLTARHRGPRIFTEREQLAREGQQAKAQLIMALHIASDKLNTVQKKIQANQGI